MFREQPSGRSKATVAWRPTRYVEGIFEERRDGDRGKNIIVNRNLFKVDKRDEKISSKLLVSKIWLVRATVKQIRFQKQWFTR